MFILRDSKMVFTPILKYRFILLLILFSIFRWNVSGDAASNSVRFVAEQTGPLTLDPHTVLQETNVNFYDNIYEGLIRHDLKGETIPSLAVSWKYISDRIIEFRLRRGVVFHNGETFNAASVKYSYDRFFAPETESQSAKLFMYYESCEIVDDYTVRIHFSKPNGVYLNSANYIKIIPANYHSSVSAEYFENHPVGTGPFQVVSREYDSQKVTTAIHLKRFDRYWRPGLVKIDKLSYLYRNKDIATDLLYRGEVDLIKDFNPLLYREATERGIQVLRIDSGDTVNGAFNTLYKDGLFNESRPFLDSRVREAVNLAIDRDKLIRDVFNGLARKTGIPGYRTQRGFTDLRPYQYDPDRARQLLREAGYPNGFRDLFWIEDIVPNLGEEIKEDLANIGIDAVIRTENENRGMETIVLPHYNKDLPDPPMGCFIFTCPDFGLSHTFFLGFITYHSEGPWSIMGDKTADEMFYNAIGKIDENEAEAAWTRYHIYMRRQHFYLPLVQRIVAYGAAKGLKFNPGEILDFTRTSW